MNKFTYVITITCDDCINHGKEFFDLIKQQIAENPTLCQGVINEQTIEYHSEKASYSETIKG